MIEDTDPYPHKRGHHRRSRHSRGINANYLRTRNAELAAEAEHTQQPIRHYLGRGRFEDVYAPSATSSAPSNGRDASYFAPNPKLRDSSPALDAINGATRPMGNEIVVHVRSGKAELGGETFDIGTGNGSAFNNPDEPGIRRHSPAPAGRFPIGQHADFYGFRSWGILNTPGREGILFHPAEVRLIDSKASKAAGKTIYRPEGETEGCITIMHGEHGKFEQKMAQVRPKYVVVRND